MEIIYKDWKCKAANITDTKTGALLYDLETHLLKPQITISRPGQSEPFAKVNIPTLSKTVDITIDGRGLKLTNKKFWKGHYIFDSSHLSQPTATWKCSGSGWSSIDFVCLDEQEMPIARVRTKVAAVKKIATLEVNEAHRDNKGLVDEIVVTGLTVVYLWMLTYSGAVAAAVS